MKLVLTVLASMILATLTWTTIYYYNHAQPVVSDIYPVYVAKIAAVYDGNLDGSKGAFVTKEVLEAAAPSFINVPILLNHNHMDVDKCIGRTTSAKVAYDTTRKQWYIEVTARIVDPGAVLKIKNGMYYAVSVSFSIEDATCSIDNLDLRECPHNMGGSYKVNGKWVVARAMLKKISGLEISFVNVPGSAGARILNFSPDTHVIGASK